MEKKFSSGKVIIDGGAPGSEWLKQQTTKSDEEEQPDRTSTGGGEENGPVTPADDQSSVDDEMKDLGAGKTMEEWIKDLNDRYGK